MMKRVLCSAAFLLLLVVFLCISVFGAELSRPATVDMDGCCFITVSGGSLGSVDIYLPVNYISGYLTLKDGIPFNASNSTVSGYVLSSSGDIRYQVRWPAWSSAEYRAYDSGYSYAAYNITGVDASNVQWITYENLAEPSDFSWNLIFLGVLVLGVVVCFIKH